MIRIINKKRNDIVVFNYIKNDLYELTDCNFNKAFIINDRIIAIIMKVLFKRKYFILMTFELMHQRYNYSKAYRLKNLHFYVYKVNRFKILKDFDCDVCDVIKIIKIINKKLSVKITIFKARMHIDF